MKIRYFLVMLLVSLASACSVLDRAFEGFVPTATPTPLTAGLYIPPVCAGKLIATMPAFSATAQPTSAISANPEISKSEQLKVFDATTKKVDEVYVSPDFNGLDWSAIVAKYRAKIDAGLDTENFYTEMQRLMAELKDQHSAFRPPVYVKADEATFAGKADYVGIGASTLPMIEKGKVTLVSILPGAPAEHGGLKPHDSILAIDGTPIIQDGVNTLFRIRGPECSAVTLRVQSPGEKARDVLFMRFRITSSVPISSQLVQTKDGARIGYIFLPSFADGTFPEQVRKTLKSFGKLDGLILDNRLNAGGDSKALLPILSYFTTGTLGYFSSRKVNAYLQIDPDPVENSQNVPLVVLVGEGTISFGEIFSGALQDVGRAKLVGQTTLGNVESLQAFNLFDGSQVWIAAERFVPTNHPNADWEKDGIIPDVEAFADWDTFTFETDPAIAAALKLLGHK